MAVKPFLDTDRPLAFAHRGAHDGEHVIENTMRAFDAAVSLGYRYLESDVHATADGRLVAFHDDVLDRVTDRVGLIRELPWSEVRRARVGASDEVPLLEDILGTWPSVRVNIDPKHDTAIEPLVEVLRRTDAVDRVCIGSFSDRRLTRIRRTLGEGLCTSMGPREIARLRAASFGVPVGRLRGDCAQVPVRQGRVTIVDERFVSRAHRADLQVHVWTIDDAGEMERLLDLGVDGIMTDRAHVLREVLQRRDQW
jgi:glycerophosphoryl diester phosphodiesterase